MSFLTRLAAPAAAMALAAALIADPAAAQAYDGEWAGALSVNGQTLHLELHVKTEGGKAMAEINSVDQGAIIPATAVKTDGGELSILFLSIGGELTGKLSADGKEIQGSWVQGSTLPLTLTKKPAK